MSNLIWLKVSAFRTPQRDRLWWITWELMAELLNRLFDYLADRILRFFFQVRVIFFVIEVGTLLLSNIFSYFLVKNTSWLLSKWKQGIRTDCFLKKVEKGDFFFVLFCILSWGCYVLRSGGFKIEDRSQAQNILYHHLDYLVILSLG